MKTRMRMPMMRRRPAGPMPPMPGDVDNPGRNPGAMATMPAANPDMMGQEPGMVPGKSMAPPRLGSLRNLKQMLLNRRMSQHRH